MMTGGNIRGKDDHSPRMAGRTFRDETLGPTWGGIGRPVPIIGVGEEGRRPVEVRF
jgi:hypothetical protein